MAATGGADPLEDSRRLEGGHETLAATQAQTGCGGKFRDGHGRVYRDFIEYQLFRSRRSLEVVRLPRLIERRVSVFSAFL